MSINNRKGSEKIMNKKNYFFCYDEDMAKYLITHNANVITTAINPRTMTTFVLFVNDNELSKLIKLYKTKIN